MTMLRLDVTPAATSAKHTGVERIIRGLARGREGWKAEPVVWDRHRARYRPLTNSEKRMLDDPFHNRPAQEAKPEGGKWSFVAKRLGQAWSSGVQPPITWPEQPGGWHLIPLNFLDARVAWLQTPTPGWRKAVLCHDIIPWEEAMREGLENARRVPFAHFVTALTKADAVICSTAHTQDRLREAWEKLDLKPAPTEVLHLPLDPAPAPEPMPANEPPSILFVSSVTSRKNHEGLLAASEILWKKGEQFRLILIGRTGKGMEGMAQRIEQVSARRPLQWRRHVNEQELEQAYREALFTVFPSLQEGFGLPIQESLLRGRPVICADFGAMNEVAGAGGTLRINVADHERLADAMAQWLHDRATLELAAGEAEKRQFLTWPDYTYRLADYILSV